MRNHKMLKSIFILLSFFLFSLSPLMAHCQIPCGIFEDNLRFDLMEEHFVTIEKSMKKIVELSEAKTLDYNQIVRWVMNKEQHADELSHIITYYFMAQRIKVVELKDPNFVLYSQQITVLHKMLVAAMKCKQSTDASLIATLRALHGELKKLYFGDKKQDHPHKH